MLKNGKSLDFKRLSGMKKVHDNSINITVDLWRRARDFFGALPCTFASLRSLTTSAKTVHRTVFFRRQVCSLLVRIPLFIFANAKSRPCDLLFVLANDSNFDRNPLRGCNYGLEGGAFPILGGCSFDVRGCSLMHNIKELQISIFSASNAIIFPFWCPTLCWNQRTLSVQFRLQHLSASFSYSGWYAQGLPRSP